MNVKFPLTVMANRFLVCSALLLSTVASLSGQRMALFLDDGARMDVREYEVQGDRVRYFSLERGQWEIVPLEIVDLERTRVHNRTVQAALQGQREEERRERFAERRARTELHGVPLDNGVYYLKGTEPVLMEQAYFDLGASKGRTVLNVIAPMPVMAGKRTLSIPGVSAKLSTSDAKPSFYLRLDKFSRFGISRLKPEPKKKRRIVQQIFVVPKVEEQAEMQDDVEVFRQQLAPLVYKVWPVLPLEAGEYAVVAYTPGETDLRAWDFSHQPGESLAGR